MELKKKMGDVEGMNEASLSVCHRIKDVFTLGLPAFFKHFYLAK